MGQENKSQISAGFSICEKQGNVQKLHTPGNQGYNANKISNFVDDEIVLSYKDNSESPDRNGDRVYSMLKRGSEKQVPIKESESIVPPLVLKDIGGNKNNTNGNTGKLTRTTMHSTQIRDKIPLNNLKNMNTEKSNQKSNIDCKNFFFIIYSSQ